MEKEKLLFLSTQEQCYGWHIGAVYSENMAAKLPYKIRYGLFTNRIQS